MSVRRLRLPPALTFIIMSAVSGMAYMTFATVAAAYRISEAGLDPLGLILVGTALELSVLIAEAPTGAFADVYGRRLSIILGFSLVGVGFVLEGAAPIFASILLAQIVWGAGYTFTSGAMQAWLADELGDEAETARTFVRAAKFESAGSLVGIALSVALASVYTGLALMAAGAMSLALAAFLAAAMTERGFSARNRAAAGGAGSVGSVGKKSIWRTMRSGFGAVAGSRTLIALTAAQMFFGMSSEPFDRLWPKHALDEFEFPVIAGLNPVVWFGVVQGAGAVGGLAAIWAMEKAVPAESAGVPRIALSVCNALMIAASAAFALTGGFGIAICAVSAVYALHWVIGPFTAAWVNRSCESEHRATVFSLHEQGNSFGQVAFGPAIGAFARARGLRAALLAATALLLPVQGLYLAAGDGGG